MSTDPYTRLLHEVGRLRQREGMNTRVGWIDDIATGSGGAMKVRAVVGYRPDGTPVKGPWLYFKGQKGTDRERRAPVKGQNVQLVAPNGDYQQAWLQTGPEAAHAPPPDHAETHGTGAYTFQNGDTYKTAKAGLQEHWVSEGSSSVPQHNPSTGDSEDTSTIGQSSPGTPLLKHVIDKDAKAIANCYKDIADTYVDDQLSRMFYTQEKVIWVDKEGCWSTKPIRVKPHPKGPHPRATKP